MVAFFTLAYNAAKTLPRTIESIRNQTCTDWLYFLLDNGSVTDNTREIVKEYAEKDSRIIPIYFDKNNPPKAVHRGFSEIIKSGADFFAMLDADDEYYPDFLEKHLTFIQENNLDISISGNDFINSETSKLIDVRKSERAIILKDNESYLEHFPSYHCFLRTHWSKLYKTSLFKKFDFLDENWIYYNIGYGADTILAMKMAELSESVGILPESLLKYYISNKSVSYRWDEKRTKSDLILHRTALDFLSAYGPISERNMEFINIVYANAIFDTVNVLSNCNLPAAEKLKELRVIADREETKKAYLVDYPDTRRSKGTMLVAALQCGHTIPEESEDFRVVVDTLLPACGRTVRKETIELFALDNSLLNTLATDNRDEYLKHLLSIISEKKYSKKFDFGKIIAALAYDKPLLDNLDDVKFIRKHQDIYLGMWNGKYLDTLHSMTDYLLSGEKASETFLTLYLNLSAALEKVDEFIFGKTKIAALYFSHKQFDKCKEILGDLTDMGVEDTEEIAAIRQKLN